MTRLLPALAVLGGCPALSDADLQHRIDRDGDQAISVVFGGTDCNDDNADVHPGAPELCDGVDNDCDGLFNAEDPDMPADEVAWYLDADGDGVGRDDSLTRTCAELPGYVHVGGDCDDTDPDQKPDQTWYLDGDGDTWGLAGHTRVQCERPSAYSLQAGDCDDANALIHPGAPEICNSRDDDCNGAADEDDVNLTGVEFWYPDADGDSYGAEGSGAFECFPDASEVLVGGDCDDTHAAVHPGAVDTWYDGVDSDCLGNSDFDQDGDGHDALSGGGDDCRDDRSWVYPGAPEVCDGVANGCDDDSWLPADEDGLAHFVPASLLPPIDEQGPLTSGGTVTIAEDGTLYLCAGAWTGQIVVTGGSVAVDAPSGPHSATLDALGLGPAVDATGAATTLTLQDVDLTGGTGHLQAAGAQGGCIYANGVASVEILGASIFDCSAFDGGGAWISAASIHLADANLSDNVATDVGGGAELGGLVTLERTVFQGNSASQGGGVYASANAGSRITDCTFDDDDASSGGGLLVDASSVAPGVAISATSFEACTAALGAGMYQSFGLVAATDTTFSADIAAAEGGAAYVDGGTLALVGGAISDCTAGAGGGIATLAAVTCEAGTAFERNAADAVLVDGAGATFDATGCDLGSNLDDNLPADVSTTDGGDFSYAGVATFSCNQAGCL